MANPINSTSTTKSKSTPNLTSTTKSDLGEILWDGVSGVYSSVDDNLAFGLVKEIVGQPSEEQANTKAYEIGRFVGDIISMGYGALEVIAGATTSAGGVVVSATGIGSVVGVPATAVGAAMMVHGTATVSNGSINLVDDTTQLFSGSSGGGGNAGRQTVTSNLGKEIDVTPSATHTITAKNPGYKGEPNSSVDILDSQGNVTTRRWFGSDGKATRDVDFDQHGNPKEHPEAPHEHTWTYGEDGKPTGRPPVK